MSLFGKKNEEKAMPTCCCNSEVAEVETTSCCCGGETKSVSSIKVLGSGCKS